jgi:hypothetical protein
MSSPMDFSKFIDPNASTGTGAGAAGETGYSGHGGPAQGPAAWSGQPTGSGGASPWLTPDEGTPDPLSGLQIAGPDSGSLTPVSSPVVWLYASIGSAVVGALGAWLFSLSALTILGWLFAGPIAIGLLGFYHKKDTLRRASGLYSEPSYVRTVYVSALVICLAAVLVTAVFVGLWWGRA